jgi:aryl-alcohol dehydrogenase-like predicted oxidoreductase
MTEALMVERRRIPGTSITSSLLGFALDPLSSASPSTDRSLAASLRRARERGITTFDLPPSVSLARAERSIAAAFPDPEPDPELLFIIGRSWSHPSVAPWGAGEARGGPTDLVRDLEVVLPEEVRRFRRYGSVMVDLDAGEAPRERTREAARILDHHRNERLIEGWSRHQRTGAPESSGDPGELTPVVSVELSLLDPSALGPLRDRASRGPLGVIARDPFSGGRLDGTRFAATLGERGPRSAPADVRSLHAEFDPVLRLGFLTRGRRRTLAQAALLFLFRWPWVSTVIVAVPRPERWEEIMGTLSAPPLDPAELAEIGVPVDEGRTEGSPGVRSS